MANVWFYWSIRRIYAAVYDEQQMLHFPLFEKTGQTLLEGQRLFSTRIAERANGIAKADVLELGCGNGEQALWLASTQAPRSYHGIDLYPPHVEHARQEAGRRGIDATFAVDDSQKLTSVADESADVVLCIESAHHYPDKPAFLRQVRRALRPGGRFAIADFTTRGGNPSKFERLIDTYCWTGLQWQEELADAGLVVDFSEDMSEGLQRGLEEVRGTLAKSGGLRTWVAGFLGDRLVAYYLSDLKGDRSYHLFTGFRE
ncbi:MAG: Methyltransferase type 11 [Caulobacter sp.]|nr:Methyltransferase type 11 [Caulobacter sp.]